VGTNYYMIYNKCNCCDRFDKAHIGKITGRWQFCFQSVHPEISYYAPDGCLAVSDPKYIIVNSWKDWEEFLQLKENVINDEYGRRVTYWELKKIVQDSMKNKNNKSHAVECRHDYIGSEYNTYLDPEGYSFVTDDFD
jgi:hypothetical protein